MGSARRTTGATVALVLLPLFLACERTPEPTPAAGSTATSAPATAAPSSRSPAPSARGPGSTPSPAILWDVPSAWQRVSHPSPMRLATYRVARDDEAEADGELTITRAGGSLDANIRRWKGQFKLAPAQGSRRRLVETNGLKIHVVELRGTYRGSRKPGTPITRPKARWAMTVAIAPARAGSVFFKLLGPERTVEAARSDFEVLLGSIRPR